MKLTLTKEEVTEAVKAFYSLEGCNVEVEVAADEVAEKAEEKVEEVVAPVEEKVEKPELTVVKTSKPKDKKIVTTVDNNNFVLDISEAEEPIGHGGARFKIDYTPYAEIIEDFINSSAVSKVVPGEGISADALKMRYKKAAKTFGLDVAVHIFAGKVSLSRVS